MPYRVTVGTDYVVDGDGNYLYDVIDDDCGHNHRTIAGAGKCQAKLINHHRDETGAWVADAYWYHSRIRHTNTSGQHVPESTEGGRF